MGKICLILVLMSLPAHASTVEIHGLWGFALSDDHEGFNHYLGQQSIGEIYAHGIVGAEAVFFPNSWLGLGMRYDWQGVKVGSAGGGPQEAQLNLYRFSAVGKVRYNGSHGYFGGVAVVGLQHNPKITIKNPSNQETRYESGTGTSGSIGFEAGFRAGVFSLGAESGLQSYRVRDIKDSSGAEAPFSVTLVGFYTLFATGLNF